MLASALSARELVTPAFAAVCFARRASVAIFPGDACHAWMDRNGAPSSYLATPLAGAAVAPPRTHARRMLEAPQVFRGVTRDILSSCF